MCEVRSYVDRVYLQEGETAVHLAAVLNQANAHEIMRLLLEVDGDVNICTKQVSKPYNIYVHVLSNPCGITVSMVSRLNNKGTTVVGCHSTETF